MAIVIALKQFIKHYTDRIKKLKKEKGFLKSSLYFINRFFFILIQNVYSKFIKINHNQILLITTSRNFECNPKYITIKLHEKNSDLKLFWVTDKNNFNNYLPDYIEKINVSGFKFAKVFASSRVIIDNATSLSHLHYKVKKNQYLIQTWHGSLGIKNFSKETNKDKLWIKYAQKEANMTDYAISNSTFETEQVYKDTFWNKTEILEYGHARNDILFSGKEKSEELKINFCKQFNIPENNKLCLYAPTFRDSLTFDNYNLDYSELKNALQKKFGGTWTIITRFHFRIREFLKSKNFDKEIIDVSSYPDIQEIMTFIDAGITDYSSWICEYMLTRKPGFIYASDLELYQENDRAFFFPLTKLPFPVSENNDELKNNILNFDNNNFINRCNDFLKEMNSFDDGHASERVAEKILSLL